LKLDAADVEERLDGFQRVHDFPDGPAEQDLAADLGRDGRMMVPVFHDVGRERTKAWALLGWDRTPLHVRYEVAPVVTRQTMPASPGRRHVRPCRSLRHR
jgi:hypothetical protein